MIARLAAFVTRWPRAVVAASVVLAALGAWLGAFHLTIDSDTDSLIAPERPFMRDYRAFLAEFGDLEGAIIAVDPRGDHVAAEAAVDFLATALAQHGVSAFLEPYEHWRLASWSASDAELTAMAAVAPALGAVAAGRDGEQPLVALELAKPRPRAYLRAPGGTILLIDVRFEKRFADAEPFRIAVDDIRARIEEARAKFPTVEIGLTGKPVLQHDEMATATADMTRASIGSMALIVVLFALFFRGLRRPLLATIAFLIATAWTYGAATLLVGHLTLLSMVFLLVLVGAGLDYGVHVVSRYAEMRRAMPRTDAVRAAVASVGPGLLAGAIATAAVFLLALFGSFGGLRELGVIAAAGIVCCAVAMLTVLPALLVLVGDGRAVPTTPERLQTAHAAPRRRVALLTLLPVALLISVAALAGVRFDLNLLNLQSPGLESVEWERRLHRDSVAASWYAVSIADSLEEVARLEALAKQEQVILRTDSVLSIIAPECDARRALRARLAAIDLPPSLEHPTAVREAARAILEGARMSLRDVLPAAVRDRMVSEGGRYLVQYFPSGDAWIPRELGRFVARVRSIDPSATGVPMTQHHSMDDLVKTFLVVSLLSLAAIAIIAWIDLRSAKLALLAAVVVVVGIGMLIGAMPIFNLSINLANFFAVPMLIGLSVDSAIHIMHRARQDASRLAETVRTVAFTALTTAIGFGALVFADHRGMRSLGAVMLLGSLCAMYVACVVLPVILRRGVVTCTRPNSPTES